MNGQEEKQKDIRNYGTLQVGVTETSRTSTFSSLQTSSTSFAKTSRASSEENLIAVSKSVQLKERYFTNATMYSFHSQDFLS